MRGKASGLASCYCAAILSFDTNLLGRLLAALPAASPKWK